MKNIRKYFINLLIFSAVFSQENNIPKESLKHGMSIAFGNTNYGAPVGLDYVTSIFTPSFSYSVQLENYIIEPGINFAREWDDNRVKTMTIVGLGIFKSKNLYKNNVDRYLGLRLNGVLLTSKYDGEQGDEDSAQIISPTYGLEYLTNNKFSISGEASLNYLIDDNNNKFMDTSSKIVFRFYL
tara:strand:- start:23 stop:571 length:549 start_codon:yes stop_codon:yes gene_type:complete